MKKYSLFLWLFLAAHLSLAQTFFEYDQAGNRIKRTFTPVPNLTPVVKLNSGLFYGPSVINARLQIIETNGAATSGLITVKLTKQNYVNFGFNPTTITLQGTPVHNANWTFNNSDPNYYVFTSTTPIAAGDVSIIGVEGTIGPGPESRLSFSVVIPGGSGGEVKLNDNAASAKVDYFVQ